MGRRAWPRRWPPDRGVRAPAVHPRSPPHDSGRDHVWNRNTSEFDPARWCSETSCADEINRASPKTQSALLESRRGSGHRGRNNYQLSSRHGDRHPDPIEPEGKYPCPSSSSIVPHAHLRGHHRRTASRDPDTLAITRLRGHRARYHQPRVQEMVDEPRPCPGAGAKRTSAICQCFEPPHAPGTRHVAATNPRDAEGRAGGARRQRRIRRADDSGTAEPVLAPTDSHRKPVQGISAADALTEVLRASGPAGRSGIGRSVLTRQGWLVGFGAAPCWWPGDPRLLSSSRSASWPRRCSPARPSRRYRALEPRSAGRSTPPRARGHRQRVELTIRTCARPPRRCYAFREKTRLGERGGTTASAPLGRAERTIALPTPTTDGAWCRSVRRRVGAIVRAPTRTVRLRRWP